MTTTILVQDGTTAWVADADELAREMAAMDFRVDIGMLAYIKALGDDSEWYSALCAEIVPLRGEGAADEITDEDREGWILDWDEPNNQWLADREFGLMLREAAELA